MPERASIFQTTQIGVESTPGTSVAASKALQSLGITLGIKPDIKTFRAAGRKYKALAVMGKEWTAGKLDGLATYSEIIYPLSSLVNYAAPVQQGATPAYLWTFSSDTDGPDTVKTFTIEQGSSVRAHKCTYGQMVSLSGSISREEFRLSGDLIGQALTDGITMTTTPTLLDLVPILPTDFDVFTADTQAGLAAASALERVLSVEWNLGDRFAPIWPLGTANGTGFPAMVEKEPATAVKIMMEADAAGMDLLTNMRAGSVFFLRLKAVGDLIDTTYYYTYQHDFCLRVTGVDEFSDEDGLYAIGWNCELFHDATWGKAFEIQITNEQTAL